HYFPEVTLGRRQLDEVSFHTCLLVQRRNPAGPKNFCPTNHERHRAGCHQRNFHLSWPAKASLETWKGVTINDKRAIARYGTLRSGHWRAYRLAVSPHGPATARFGLV